MKKLLIYISLLGSLIGVLVSTPASAATYTFYRSITVTSTATVASGTNTNFPMLFGGTYTWLESSSTGGGLGKIQNLTTAPNGAQEPADLAFSTANTCNSFLNYETESYVSSTGVVNFWVQVPTLATATVIYACYDDSGTTTDQSHPSSTWNTNYASVWHFPAPTSTVTVKDSTSNAKNGTLVGTPTATSSQVDGGLAITDPTANYVSIPSVSLASDFTIEGWANLIAVLGGNDADIVGAGSGNSLNAFGQKWRLYDGSGDVVADPSNVLTGTWHQIAVTRSGTTVTLYRDGVAVATGASSFTFVFSNVGNGGVSNPSGSYIYDEVRIANISISPSWIATQYNNQNSPSTFYAIGSETNVPSSGGNATGTANFFITGILKFIGKFFLR